MLICWLMDSVGAVANGAGADMQKFLVIVFAGAIVGGCAKSASDVTGSYISPIQYQNYSCNQLREEAQRISARVAQTSGVQDQKRSNDQIATAAAIVIFWPAAFLVGGDDQNTAELARLKGEFEAIEQASIQKNCGIQFQQGPGAPPPPNSKT